MSCLQFGNENNEVLYTQPVYSPIIVSVRLQIHHFSFFIYIYYDTWNTEIKIDNNINVQDSVGSDYPSLFTWCYASHDFIMRYEKIWVVIV